MSGCENFFCFALATGDSTVDYAVVPGNVGVFSGEELYVRDRCSKRCLPASAASLDVAVGAARERVGVPVVKIGPL